ARRADISNAGGVSHRFVSVNNPRPEGLKGRHTGDCVGPPGLICGIFRIPVAHATGIACAGLPALTKCATSKPATQG
ncbi:MAG: hypothetical protein O2856_20210, partial [Planctomycetota bacterium]|nr:hypothetical protein [Planctomycetota bacterium]